MITFKTSGSPASGATALGKSGPSSRAPVDESHCMNLLSAEPAAMVLPSWEKATGMVWKLSVDTDNVIEPVLNLQGAVSGTRNNKLSIW